MARPDFRATAARRLSEERELSPAIISLLSPEGDAAAGRRPQHSGRPHRAQPRPAADELRRGRAGRAGRVDHGARRPAAGPGPAHADDRTLPARRRRAPLARRHAWPVCTSSRPSSRRSTTTRRSRSRIIENLQREDLSPLEEALMYERMMHRPRLQRAQAGPEAGQGQGLHREPAAPGRRADRDQAARVFAQRHPVTCLRAAQGRGSRASAAGWPSRSPAAS